MDWGEVGRAHFPSGLGLNQSVAGAGVEWALQIEGFFVFLFVGLRTPVVCGGLRLTKDGTYATLKAYLGYQVLLGNSPWR